MLTIKTRTWTRGAQVRGSTSESHVNQTTVSHPTSICNAIAFLGLFLTFPTESGINPNQKMLLKLRKFTGDNSVRWLLQNGALFFSTKQASMAQKSPPSHKVQALYDLCRQTFPPSGTPPLSSHSVQKLCSLLGTFLICVSSFPMLHLYS